MQSITSDAIERIRAWLKALPNQVKNVASAAVAEYLIGDASHGLKHYPPYKHVPYSQMGGFVSDKQRKYVMARIREGSITPGISASNGYFREAWTYKAQGSRYEITNDVGYAKYLVGPGTQARRPMIQGWRKWTDTIRENSKGAIRHAIVKINEWMKAHPEK
jgi:hypothetical protein